VVSSGTLGLHNHSDDLSDKIYHGNLNVGSLQNLDKVYVAEDALIAENHAREDEAWKHHCMSQFPPALSTVKSSLAHGSMVCDLHDQVFYTHFFCTFSPEKIYVLS
jgi:hypothetical protein